MGTSASGGGAGGGNPLVPSWIGGGNSPAPAPPPPDPDNDPGTPDQSDNGNDTGNQNNNGNNDTSSQGGNSNSQNQQGNSSAQSDSGGNSNRYRQPRIQFNKFVTSGGQNRSALKSALKGYSRNAAGGTGQMARRMLPTISRVAGFYQTINTIKDQGKGAALRQFHLGSYENKPLSEILSALSDEIFKDTGKIYEDTQDDSITKHAYSNTVIRICELDEIDLNNLTNQQIEVMTSVFIEETIAQRVINDIGNLMTEKSTDVKQLVELENNVYQIVSGMVRNLIMPEIIATQRGDKTNIENKIENIYRIAFDTLGGINN